MLGWPVKTCPPYISIASEYVFIYCTIMSAISNSYDNSIKTHKLILIV